MFLKNYKIMKNLKIIIICTFLAALSSCTNPDSYRTPDFNGICNDLTPTKTVEDITSSSTATPQKYTEDDVIEAYVTSSDEGGNFYKSISFISTDGNLGFSMPIDDYNLYTKFEPGRKVYVNMKDRYFFKQYGSTVIGSFYNGGTPDLGSAADNSVGRISGIEYKDVIIPSCATKVNESDIIKKLSIKDAKNDKYLNMLIEFDGVQFEDAFLGKNYFDPDNQIGGATNNSIIDASGSSVILRVSQYATFASDSIPSKRGKIIGVMTKFCSSRCDYQFMIRTINDVQLTEERVSITSPLGGTDIQFNGTLSESFTAFNVGDKVFPKYVNDFTIGNRYWAIKQFPTGTGNKYIEMSSFNGAGKDGVPSKSYFFVPVDFTSANSFTFKKEIRFNKGEALKVYYVKSSDYSASGPIKLSTFVNITSAFSIVYPAIDSSDNSFTSAGIYNIPSSLTGTGFFVFEYTGTATVTTTIQIDDITVN